MEQLIYLYNSFMQSSIGLKVQVPCLKQRLKKESTFSNRCAVTLQEKFVFFLNPCVVLGVESDPLSCLNVEKIRFLT